MQADSRPLRRRKDAFADELVSVPETESLLRSPKNAERLRSALARARRGEGKPETVEELRRDLGLDDAG